MGAPLLHFRYYGQNGLGPLCGEPTGETTSDGEAVTCDECRRKGGPLLDPGGYTPPDLNWNDLGCFPSGQNPKHVLHVKEGLGQSSDLDAFRGMLERAGIGYETGDADDDNAPGARVCISVGGFNHVTWVYFDASGALKRVDGGA